MQLRPKTGTQFVLYALGAYVMLAVAIAVGMFGFTVLRGIYLEHSMCIDPRTEVASSPKAPPEEQARLDNIEAAIEAARRSLSIHQFRVKHPSKSAAELSQDLISELLDVIQNLKGTP